MSLSREVLERIRDILMEYNMTCAHAAKVADLDAKCLPEGDTKTFFEKESEQLWADAKEADELRWIVMQELEALHEIQ